ncbi:MAG: hypothetical protein CME62_05530 [Halobacteriovoraceae bacterium]|nr:hypothetical protein [Halobacteriovoraceae bacterium]|tara:strand:+ start:7144 stop:7869 length:726 start_codon:yes stop_codon:yes gene_type:complete
MLLYQLVSFKNILFLFIFFNSVAYAKWITGVGYFDPGEYRVENEISPMPLGWNIVPMIGYVSPKMRVIGPRISYHIVGNKAVELRADINAIGDRYESHEVEMRDTAIDGGMSLRLMFLTFGYSADISNVYYGNNYSWGLSWRFILADNFFIIPSFTQKYFSSEYTNFYFGVKESEEGYFNAYEVDASKISTLRLTTTLKLNEKDSIAFTVSQREFEDEVYDSPTVAKKRYLSSSLFWNYSF